MERVQLAKDVMVYLQRIVGWMLNTIEIPYVLSGCQKGISAIFKDWLRSELSRHAEGMLKNHWRANITPSPCHFKVPLVLTIDLI